MPTVYSQHIPGMQQEFYLQAADIQENISIYFTPLTS